MEKVSYEVFKKVLSSISTELSTNVYSYARKVDGFTKVTTFILDDVNITILLDNMLLTGDRKVATYVIPFCKTIDLTSSVFKQVQDFTDAFRKEMESIASQFSDINIDDFINTKTETVKTILVNTCVVVDGVIHNYAINVKDGADIILQVINIMKSEVFPEKHIQAIQIEGKPIHMVVYNVKTNQHLLYTSDVITTSIMKENHIVVRHKDVPQSLFELDKYIKTIDQKIETNKAVSIISIRCVVETMTLFTKTF